MTDRIFTYLEPVLQSYSIDTPILHSLALADYPEQIKYFVTEGQRAVACWHTLRGIVDQTGLWPVMLGGLIASGYLLEGSNARHQRQRESKPLYRRLMKILEGLNARHWRQPSVSARQLRQPPVSTILETAITIDVEAWLQEALRQNTSEDEPWDTSEGEFALRSEWPSDIMPTTTFSLPYDWRTGTPYPRVMIGLVPTTQSWQVPAYLRFGDYNACPSPAEHASVLRRWMTQYDAEVVGITHDVIELRVTRPPMTRDHALALAYEQFAYCSDIVTQGFGALDALAATLLNGSVWSFWWD